jgi:hypothetical protein
MGIWADYEVVTAPKLNATFALYAPQTAVTAEAGTRAAADTAEAAARIAADTTETAARIAGDSAIVSSVSTEATARIAGDTTESAARIAGDSALASGVATESAARIAADLLLLPLTGGHVQNPGTFTNAAMGLPLTSVLGTLSLSTEFQVTHPANFSQQAFAAGVSVPSGSTAYDACAVAGYVVNSSTTTSGTAAEFYARAAADGATVYGINPLVTDQKTSGGTGWHAGAVVGAEFDIGAFNPLTNAYGVNMIGVFPNGTPSTAVGYQLAVLNAAWGYGFLTGDAAAVTGIQLGSAHAAANSDGQPITLAVRDATNTVQIASIVAQHVAAGANLVFETPTGGVVMTNTMLAGGLATFSAGQNVVAAGGSLVSFLVGATQVGSITTTGSATVYNTTSDYRLKTVYGQAAAAGIINAVPVHDAVYNDHLAQRRPMFLAHELQAAAPWAVTGALDAVDAEGNPVYQQVDQTSLIPTLWRAIQELTARIAALEAPHPSVPG